jgi:formylglycine-generating enzyme required for sulfatase activity
MVEVDGSVFLSGPSNDPLWLPGFYIDVHPVSNADYARFIAATGHSAPQHRTADGAPFPENLGNHPVVFVTWNDATAYAEWAGKALPTSQQWEKAARGTRGTAYPWGDQPTPAKCNVRENGVGNTTPVDCYQSGVSPYGAYDMCGNVWEWCSSETARSARTQGRRLDKPIQPRYALIFQRRECNDVRRRYRFPVCHISRRNRKNIRPEQSRPILCPTIPARD